MFPIYARHSFMAAIIKVHWAIEVKGNFEPVNLDAQNMSIFSFDIRFHSFLCVKNGFYILT